MKGDEGCWRGDYDCTVLYFKTKMLRQARRIWLQVFQLCQYRQIMAAASASVADEWLRQWRINEMRDRIRTPHDARLPWRGVCGLWLLLPSRPKKPKNSRRLGGPRERVALFHYRDARMMYLPFVLCWGLLQCSDFNLTFITSARQSTNQSRQYMKTHTVKEIDHNYNPEN